MGRRWPCEDRKAHRESDAKMKVEIGVIHVQAKEYQGLLVITRN